MPFASAVYVTPNISSVITKQTVTYTFSDGFLNLTDATYMWCWGDGSYNDTTVVPYASHSYSLPGNYLVTVVVYAGLSNDVWSVSGDWSPYYAGSYSSELTVLPNPQVDSLGVSLLSGLALFGVVPVVVGALVFIIVLKGFSENSDGDPRETVLPALFSAVVIVIMVEIFMYIGVYAISALTV